MEIIACFIIWIQSALISVASGTPTLGIRSQFPGGQWCGSRMWLNGHAIPDREIFRSKLQCAVVSSFITDKEDAVYVGIAEGQTTQQGKLYSTLFARGLMRSCEKAISERSLSAKELLIEGHRLFQSSGEMKFGEATAMALRFDKATGILESLNVGLNKYIVFRNRKATNIRSTDSASPKYAMPYTVGFYDPSMGVEDEENSNRFIIPPQSGAFNTFQLQDRDVLIVGTEDLFDALSTRVIGIHVRRQLMELTDDSVEAHQMRQYQPAMLQHLDILAESLGRAAMNDPETAIEEVLVMAFMVVKGY
ncbi:hypothetical protein BKA69DRAFT_1163555 [Paraphysoderma sedebokerense]|nr:hypothetical protein BKA69DRAFT_1163555 [Paraphysoderma sedebokerense]